LPTDDRAGLLGFLDVVQDSGLGLRYAVFAARLFGFAWGFGAICFGRSLDSIEGIDGKRPGESV
jgi:hypothetical protein